MKHKHAEVIKAWADGAIIEVQCGREWFVTNEPTWYEKNNYRVKPEFPDSTKLQKRRLYIYNNIMEGKTYISATKYHPAHEGPHCTYMGSIEVDE
jgi:hypothetical protein